MSFSNKPSNMHLWENAAFERCGDFTGEKNLIPLHPVSIKLSLFPRLQWSEESRTPHLTFTTSFVTARHSKEPRMPESDDDGNVEAEIEEIENEIRLLSENLVALRNKKAEKDVKAAISKPPETCAAAIGCKEKDANFAVNSVMPCCRKQGVGFGQSEKGGKPPLFMKQKPPIVKVPEGRTGAAAIYGKKSVKRDDAAAGSLKTWTPLHEWPNPATRKRSAKSDNSEDVSIPCQHPALEPKRKRREWSVLPESRTN